MSQWVERTIASEIRDAITAEDRSTYVFYITGAGGEGKTILLRQIGMMLGSEDGIAAHFPWSGILDLYDTSLNSSTGLESRLRAVLGTASDFRPYDQEQDRYKNRIALGFVGTDLESARQEVAEAFAKCVNTITLWSRVVIAIDTTERIQYEVDGVQKLCKLEDESTTVKAWLLNQLRSWRNCVVLLVGRPEAEPYLGKALAENLSSHPEVHYVEKTLGPFSREESQEYFAKQESECPIIGNLDLDFRNRVWQVTEGRAIRLALTLELIRNQPIGFDHFRRTIEEGDPEEARREIDRLLVDIVMNGELSNWMRDTLLYLAVARKGLDVGLLSYLEIEWDFEICQARIEAVRDRPFVKRHPEEGRLYLHDEMYQLLDTYLLKPETVQRLSARIVQWYDQQLAGTEAGDDPNGEATTRIQNLQIDSLLYRLRADPYQGYYWYARKAEEAIRASETSLDMQLRHEILSFLQSVSPIDRRLLHDVPELTQEFNSDSAARWVKRYMRRGDYRQAINVAEKTREIHSISPISDDAKSRLAQADLSVYWAQALIYSGRVEAGAELIRGAISSLDRDRGEENLVPPESDAHTVWRRGLVLGRAHNNLGYAYARHLGHYRAAISEFGAARPYFSASGQLEELANTSSNMGRVYALLRHPTRAKALVDESYEVREKLGQDYRIGLSLNARAIVAIEFKDVYRARQLAIEALSIFERLSMERGTGIALITLGRAERHMGNVWTEELHSQEDCDQYFRHSADHLNRAVRIFSENINEPMRLVEALNELGCAYRDRARSTKRAEPDSRSSTISADEAITILERCAQLAEKHSYPVLYIDTCEDIAQTYFMRMDYDGTAAWLDRAEDRIPANYKFFAKRGLVELPEAECVEAFWLYMAKIELLRGDLVFDSATNGGSRPATREVVIEAAQHYLFSTAYLERYSGRAIGLDDVFKQMWDRLKHATVDDLTYLQREGLPAIADEYGIDVSRLLGFFEDTLGFALELRS